MEPVNENEGSQPCLNPLASLFTELITLMPSPASLAFLDWIVHLPVNAVPRL